jgi:signal transduction histidine kinase
MLLAITMQDEDDFQWLVLGVMATVLIIVSIALVCVLKVQLRESRKADRMEKPVVHYGVKSGDRHRSY